MKFALAQLNPTIGNLQRNAQDILEAAQAAQVQGAQVLLTPELSLCGYPPRDLLLQPYFIQQMNQVLKQLAQDLPMELWVLVGTVSEHGRSPNRWQTA
ncbi:MAG: NAD+ synthase, partial [Synechococcales cyanobacterium RU_4_20]|nr:NAD+ synthase [Synechococcales cyanobacterium RU_4_20]